MALSDGSEILVRPIRPDDERFYQRFMEMMTPEDIRLRLFAPVREFSHKFLARMTQIDYGREMAFIALRPLADGSEEMLGVVRFFADPDYEKGEYAVLVRSDFKGQGLGWALMLQLIRHAKARDSRCFTAACFARIRACCRCATNSASAPSATPMTRRL